MIKRVVGVGGDRIEIRGGVLWRTGGVVDLRGGRDFPGDKAFVPSCGPTSKQPAGTFVDGAYVGTSGLSTVANGKGAVTPGLGFRYRSPLGVLRLDFGLRPVGHESLPVVVAVPDARGNEQVVRLTREKSYSPVEDPSPGTWHAIARRIVVHFAMGQAF